jgi:glycosyltransferase involved in cell wall biosynthesis
MSTAEQAPKPDVGKPGRGDQTRMRLAVIINMVAPYTKPLFTRLAERDDCEVLVISETPMERDKHWRPEADLAFEHVLLDSWTLDLARLAVGSGFKRRADAYLYVPKRPLAPLRSFSPDVVVAAGGGIWSSPANIAALATRRRRGWAFVPWWGSIKRERPTWPRRLAEPWVRHFMTSADAWLAYGSRQARELVELGADPSRTVIAPISAVVPERPAKRHRPAEEGQTRYLFVGRLIETKGVDVLLEAFRQLDAGELWVAGDGPLRPMVEAAAARDPRIRLLGYVEGAALADVYGQADVFVLPSLYEAWGLVVHEALAYGLPVIASDQVGAADDLIDPGTNGYVVRAGSSPALAEAMRAVAGWTDEQWQRAGKRSSETTAACTIERAAEGFVRGCAIALEHRRRHER